MIPALVAFVVPNGQIPGGVDPHFTTVAFWAFKFEILDDCFPARLPFMARLLWQLQVRQIIPKKGIFHESGAYGQIRPL